MRCGSPPVLLALLCLSACGQGPSGTPDEPPIDNTIRADTPTSIGAADHTPDASAAPSRVAIRHILLEFSNDREREEAISLATQLEKDIRTGEDMALLAKKHSKDGTAPRGGFLGAAERGAWVEPFETAAFALEIGEVSGPVETEYGIHILRREPLTEVKLMHLLVAHKDAKNVAKKRSPVGKRSREEALEIVNRAFQMLEDGEEFSVVAAELSDTPMAKRGADLGWFVRGELGPEFDRVAFELQTDAHSDVFETVFGFHIIRRLE